MPSPPIPDNEDERLDALRRLNILDTPPEERFDRFTRMARRLFEVPTALISLVDESRQWFKSCQGLNATETSREVAFCAHTILSDHVLVVNDARVDERFRENPLVLGPPHIRFYAGAPLIIAPGIRAGTLCLIDQYPRHFPGEEQQLLRDLASMVGAELLAVQLATMDDETGLTNRRGLVSLGGHALSMCRRLGKSVMLLVFVVSETGATQPGSEQQTRDFASLLTRVFRDADLVARVRNGEFAVLVTDCPPDELPTVMARLEGQIQTDSRTSPHYRMVSVPYDPRRHESMEALLAAGEAQARD